MTRSCLEDFLWSYSGSERMDERASLCFVVVLESDGRISRNRINYARGIFSLAWNDSMKVISNKVQECMLCSAKKQQRRERAACRAVVVVVVLMDSRFWR